jgi:hypothetical protein
VTPGVRARVAAAVLSAPTLLAVGFGLWSPLSAAQLAAAFRWLDATLAVLRPLGLPDRPGVGVAAAVAAVVGVRGLARRSEVAARWVEAAVLAAAAAPLIWLLLLAWGFDAPLCLAALLLAASPGRAPVGLGAGVGVAALAAASVAEDRGTDPASPLFLFADAWVAGPGAVVGGTAAAWLAVGLGAWWAAGRPRPERGIWMALPFVALSVALASASGLQALAAAGSAVGALALVVSLGGRAGGVTAPLLAAVFVLRGLSVYSWTVPEEQPGLVVADDQRGVFSVLWHEGALLWSSRDHNAIGRLGGGRQRWSPRDGVTRATAPADRAGVWSAGDVVEGWLELGGRPYVAVQQGAQTLLMEMGEAGPGALHLLGRCNPTTVLPGSWIGCETAGRLLRWDDGVVEERPLVGGLEAGVLREDRLFGVELWGSSDLVERTWPGLQEVGRRRLGPVGWTLGGGQSLIAGRYLEGALLRVGERVRAERLSLGVRALAVDDARDRIWVLSSLTGRLWLLGDERRSWAVCGRGRDLALDDRGRAWLGTDCGILVVDPEAS